MKNLIRFSLALGLLTLSLQAQTYSIDWFKVAGGGGTSAGGGYQVSGTIGQADAGFMNGGDYSLVGGFWSFISVLPVPGVPILTIQRTATNTVLITWPSPSTGFTLQQQTTPTATTWVNVPQVPTDDGTTKSIVVNPPVGTLYYRLKK